jgi:hypothetical protein
MKALSIVVVSLSLGLVACASSVRAKETSTGGELTLTGNRGETLGLAKPVMAAKCGGAEGYDIVEDSGAGTRNDDQGEWRITYHCKGGQKEAKPASAPPKS